MPDFALVMHDDIEFILPELDAEHNSETIKSIAGLVLVHLCDPRFLNCIYLFHSNGFQVQQRESDRCHRFGGCSYWR